MTVTISASIFAVLTGIVVVYQGCLAAGVPWGEASMGGKYPGKYPPKMRIVAVINMLILTFLAFIVLSHADLILPQLKKISHIGIWVVVAFYGISTVLNSITPSKIERNWAPVAFLQLITSLLIGIN